MAFVAFVNQAGLFDTIYAEKSPETKQVGDKAVCNYETM